MNKYKMPNDLTSEQIKAVRVVCNLPADLRVKLNAECYTEVFNLLDNFWLSMHFGFLEFQMRADQPQQLYNWLSRNANLVLTGGKRN